MKKIEVNITLRSSSFGAPGAVSILLDNAIPGLWVFGKEPPETDIVLEDKITTGPTLQDSNLQASHFCLVQVNTSTIARIGGVEKYGGSTSTKTYFCHIDEDTWRWVNGPELISKRRDFGCAIFEHMEQLYIIAVGGNRVKKKTLRTKTVEFLDLTKNKWISGE